MTSKYGFSTERGDASRRQQEADQQRREAQLRKRDQDYQAEYARNQAIVSRNLERAAAIESKANEIVRDFEDAKGLGPALMWGINTGANAKVYKSEVPDAPIELDITVIGSAWNQLSPSDQNQLIRVIKEQTGVQNVQFEDIKSRPDSRPKGPMSRGS